MGGFIDISGQKEKLDKVYFISPSAHHFTGNSFDMECVIKTKSFSLITFWKEDEEESSEFLQGIGFGSGMLRKLRLHQKVDIPEPKSFKEELSNDLTKFLSYDGESLFGKCEPTKYIISLEVINMSPHAKKEIFFGENNGFVIKERKMSTRIYKNFGGHHKKKKVTPAKKKTPQSKKVKKNKSTKQKTDGKSKKKNLKNKLKDKKVVKANKSSIRHKKKEKKKKIKKKVKINYVNEKDPGYRFDAKAFTYFFSQYPPTRGDLPPKNPDKYPSTRFPYPGTFRWTGEPNYPNDPLYPQYLFPPQPPMSFKHWPFNDEPILWKKNEYPRQWPRNRIPRITVRNLSAFAKTKNKSSAFSFFAQASIVKVSKPKKVKKEVKKQGKKTIKKPSDDLSPVGESFEYHYSGKPSSELEQLDPFGYPIWPDGISPSWPNYQADFPSENEGPRIMEQSGDNKRPLIIISPHNMKEQEDPEAMKAKIRKKLKKRDLIPKMLHPAYTYPLKEIRESDEPDQINHPPSTDDPEYPRDPNLIWPQNPFYTWQPDPDYIYPPNLRFFYPTDPKSTKFPWPKDPIHSATWHTPIDSSWLPNSRAPKDPRIPPKPHKKHGFNQKDIERKSNRNASKKKKISLRKLRKKITDKRMHRSKYPYLRVHDKPNKASQYQENQKLKHKFNNHYSFSEKQKEKQKVEKLTHKLSPKDPKNPLYPFLRKKAVPIHDKHFKKKNLNLGKIFHSRYRAPIIKKEIVVLPGIKKFGPRKMKLINKNSIKKPRSRPFFERIKPYFVFMKPHSRAPFPCSKKREISLYRGIPNQPIGLIPPHGIPYWVDQPSDVSYRNLKKCKAPKGSKFMVYFYHPVPFRSGPQNKRVYIPQYILIKKTDKIPKKPVKFINILMKAVKSLKDKKINKLVPYKMPVLFKPVDPQLRNKLKNYNWKKNAAQARNKFNQQKKLIEVCSTKKKDCRRRLRRHLRTRRDRALRDIKRKCNGEFGCIELNKLRLFKKHPDYQVCSKRPKFDPSLFKFKGYRKRCAHWYVGVIVNRHFQNSKQWKLKDFSYDPSGKLRYCKKWIKAPIFMKRIFTQLGSEYDFKWVSLSKVEIKEICKHKLDILLNHSSIKTRELRDSLEITCKINKKLITKKIHV